MIVWWGSEMAEAVTEPMIVGQAAIGGKIGALVDFLAMAETAVAETTGKKETMIEAVRPGQVRSGLGVTDGTVAEQLVLAAMIG